MSLMGMWRAVVDAFSGSCRWSPRCCWRRELDSASFGLSSPVEMRWRWSVRVQRVVMAVTGAESWTVVDGGWALVEPVERYLAHLAGIERSPNTVRAYAHGLRLWFEFLGARRLVWDSVGVEDVSRFVAWLRAPAGNVVVFDDTAAVRGAATVNRRLAALFGFYDLRARSGGVGVAAGLVAWRRGSRGSCKPFLRGIASDGPVRTRPPVARRLAGAVPRPAIQPRRDPTLQLRHAAGASGPPPTRHRPARRHRPTRPGHRPPVPPHLRHPVDQHRRPPARHRAAPRPCQPPDDRPLRRTL